MVFLFVSLACLVLCAAIFAATFGIDHFASIWEMAEPNTWRRRFSAWATESRKLDVVQGLSAISSVFAGLAFIVAVYYALTFVGVGGERRFALYISGGPDAGSGEALREFHATRADLNRVPAFDYVGSHRIVKGRVSSTLPIGGGLTHVCVDHGKYCGLADSSLELKAGDTAYLRIGRPPTGERPPGWMISANEAKSLASTEKFSIEEK